MNKGIEWERLYELQDESRVWLGLCVGLSAGLIGPLLVIAGIAGGNVGLNVTGWVLMVLATWAVYILLFNFELDQKLLQAISEQPWCEEATAELTRAGRIADLRMWHYQRIVRIQARHERASAQARRQRS